MRLSWILRGRCRGAHLASPQALGSLSRWRRKDDTLQWVSVAVFGKAAEKAAELKKSDRCYIEGTIKLDSWAGNDGTERHGLSVAAFKCEPTHRIGRKRPDQKKKESDFGSVGANDSAEFDDDIAL